MNRMRGEHVLQSAAPVPNASGLVFTGNDVCVFGTMEGRIVTHQCQYYLVDHERRFSFGPKCHEFSMVDNLPVDCLVAAERSMVVACLHSTNKVVWIHIASSGEIDVVWSGELPGDEIYTNRYSAHCWESSESLLVGCFSGAVVRITQGTTAVVARDTSAITQLTVDSVNGMLVSSSVNRNCFAGWNPITSSFDELKQIGQKPRDQGYYGACSFRGERIFAARHNNRVFEADNSGVVLRTYKMPDGTPLGLLFRLDDSSAAEQVFVWSESPQFASVILFSVSRSEVVWKNVPAEGTVLVCSTPYLDSVVTLYSDDTMTVCPFRDGPPPPLPPPPAPPQGEATDAPTAEEPLLRPKSIRKVSLVKVVKRRVVKVSKSSEGEASDEQALQSSQSVREQQEGVAEPEPPTTHVPPPPPPVVAAETETVAAVESHSPVVETTPAQKVVEESASASPPPPPPTAAAAVEEQHPLQEEETLDDLPDISDFIDRIHKLYRTFGARQLDKKAQPQILQEVTSLVPEIQSRLTRKRPIEAARAANEYFTSDLALELHTLLKASYEWVIRLPLFDDRERVDQATMFWGLLDSVGALNRLEESDMVSLYEDTVRRLGVNVFAHEFVRTATHNAIDLLFPRRNFPLLPTSASSHPPPGGSPHYLPMENHLIAQSLDILEDLQLCEAPASATRYFFPYLFAVFPSKAMNTAISLYPSLSIRFLEEALSGPVYNEALSILRRNGCTVEALGADDVVDYFCDLLLLIAQEHKDTLQTSSDCLPRLIGQLLSRRASMLDCRYTQQPSFVRRKKRVEDTVLDLIKTCPLNISIAHPSLRDICDRYEFAEGVVALRAVTESIHSHVASDRIDKLMPLFCLPEANTEGNWVVLFTASHRLGRLDAAIMLSVALHVQQPKRVRSFLRKSFPFLDSPDMTDEQLRNANRKLAVIIGG